MPDELCEVAEICDGTSLISSSIISCRVHHLRPLRRTREVIDSVLSFCFFFNLPSSLHLERGFIFSAEIRDEDEKETEFTAGNIKNK